MSLPTVTPAEVLDISPEALEVANCYLQNQDIDEVATTMDIPREMVTALLYKKEVRAYIDNVFFNLGFNNRFRMREAMDAIIKKKFQELEESETGSSKDIAEQIARSSVSPAIFFHQGGLSDFQPNSVAALVETCAPVKAAADDVLIARAQLLGGTVIENIAVKGLIPPGHKIATHAIAVGDPVRRYNQIIGFASQAIAPGEHVHTHNLNMGAEKGNFERDYAIGQDVKPEPVRKQASFMGYKRSDGRVATRNYIGVLSSVNCSATAARAIADHFSKRNNPQALAKFPNVDGVVALTHGTGCGMDTEGLGIQLLERTLAGYATHANFWGVVVVGLGCEANQLGTWLAHSSLREGDTLKVFNIQDTGGTRLTVEKGIALIEEMLPRANAITREPCSAEHITVGLQCGGSDAFSGVTANPAVGYCADLLVRAGATVMFSENTEVRDAVDQLTSRAATPEVAEAIVWLLSDRASYTTMSFLDVSGGR